MFNSRSRKYRDPVGAVAEGTPIHFRITLPRELSCSAAHLVIQREGSDTQVLDLFWCGMNGNNQEWWECHFTPGASGLYFYHFEVRTHRGSQRLSKGFAGDGIFGGNNQWQLTVYDKAFQTPDWLEGGIMYQIFPDRFYKSGAAKGEIPTGRTFHENWQDQPDWAPNAQGKITNTDFFGGDLQGIREKLPYLKELGVTCLYMNPIFESHSNHRYDTADYSKIDPLLGDEEDFRALCQAAKELGIRVVIDGVFSHTGSDSVYFNREGRYPTPGAYNSQQSPYYPWYSFRQWPDSYDCWWNFDTLPNVNEMEKSYRAFINGEDGVAAHWIKAGTAGWRLDVADELPMPFLRELRRRVKSTDEEATLLGEVWEDPTNKIAYGEARCYCAGDTLDSVMNYPLREAVLAFFTFKIDAYALVRRIEAMRESMPPSFFYSLMNLLGSHDKPRAINVLADCGNMQPERRYRFPLELTKEQYERGKRRLIAAWTLICALPGMPCIYYGDEAGLTGMADPFCRKTFPWGREDEELTEKMREQSLKRRNSPALRTGDMRIYAESADALVVERFIEHGQDVFGNSAKDERARVRVDRKGL